MSRLADIVITQMTFFIYILFIAVLVVRVNRRIDLVSIPFTYTRALPVPKGMGSRIVNMDKWSKLGNSSATQLNSAHVDRGWIVTTMMWVL